MKDVMLQGACSAPRERKAEKFRKGILTTGQACCKIMSTMKREAAFRKPRRPKKVMYIATTLLVAMFVAFFAYKGSSLRKDKEMLDRQISQTQEKLDDEEARTRELQEFEVYTHTKKYAEEVAKDVLGYVYDGEIIFQPD